jgi:hypothetical protein
VEPAAIWERAYADATAWSKWSSEIKSARLDGPLALGANRANRLPNRFAP